MELFDFPKVLPLLIPLFTPRNCCSRQKRLGGEIIHDATRVKGFNKRAHNACAYQAEGEMEEEKKAELEHLLNREQIADAFEFRILLLRLHDVLPLRYHIRFGD
jgi:hypothetical protein